MTALFSSTGRAARERLCRVPAFGLRRVSIALALLFLKFLLLPCHTVAAEGEGFRPTYYRQLEAYAVEIERQSREETLENALVQYRIQPGDRLGDIAADHGVSLEELLCWNDLHNPHLIYPEQIINIVKVEGTLHTVLEGETVREIADRYRVASHAIEEFNMVSGESLEPGEQLIIPGGEVPEEDVRAASNLLLASRASWSGPTPAGGGNAEVTPDLLQQAPAFAWPAAGSITSTFGPRAGSFHYGLDIAAPYGSLIRAAAGGEVEFAGHLRGYGLTLILQHGRGWSTLYAHNSKLLVGEGQRVGKSEPVAQAGTSGNATGPHLHFEVIFNGQKLDPMPFLER